MPFFDDFVKKTPTTGQPRKQRWIKGLRSVLEARGGRLPHSHGTARIEPGGLDAAGQEDAVADGERLQRVLQVVDDGAQKARSQPDREQGPGLLDRIAEADPAGALEHLRVGGVAEDPQDLGLQALVRRARRADVDHLVLHQPTAADVGELEADDVLLDGGDASDDVARGGVDGQGLAHRSAIRCERSVSAPSRSSPKRVVAASSS
jgi:hypothetical protein